MFKKRQPGVRSCRALRPQAVLRPTHVGQHVTGLHRGDDFQLFEAGDLLRRGDLRMFDAQAEFVSAARAFDVGLARRFLGLGEGIESHLHSLVADGVKANLESGEHALFRQVIQLGRVIAGQAGVLCIVGIRLQQRRGVRSERAIHVSLEHAGVQHQVGLRMRVALSGQFFDGIIEGQPLRNAGGEFAFFFEFLVDLKIFPRRAGFL